MQNKHVGLSLATLLQFLIYSVSVTFSLNQRII